MDAVHERFIGAHHRSGWRGEARRFGEGVAILVGDLAFVYADLLLAGVPREALSVYNELRIEVNIGQYLDLLGTARGHPTVDDARRICIYKSGKYTVERPLHLGAALHGRLRDFAGELTAYGIPLGEAFQLRDDLLGALGDGAVTGKPVGDDLREGKPTALIAHALIDATAAQAELLDRIGEPDLSDSQIADLQQVLCDTGAVRITESAIERLRDEAIVEIRRSGLTRAAVDALVELAYFVTDRDH